MNNFDARWQTCAGQARHSPPREETAPFGFAGRVAARALAGAPAPAEFIGMRQAARWLAGALAVLGFCAALELPHWRTAPPLETGIENAVAQLVWSL